jgi:hypothetical protein
MAKAARKNVVAVAPIVPAPLLITQEEIKTLAIAKKKHAQFAERAKELAEEVAKAEAQLLSKLRSAQGATCEAGKLAAILETSAGACRPKWKDEAIALAVASGKHPTVYEAEVKVKYPPTPTYHVIVVEAK